MTALITRSVRGAATTLAILLTTASASIVALPAARAAAASPSVPVIIDTDIYSNTDDEGALAVAFGLQLEGSANVLAIGIDTRTSRPQVATSSWQCAAAITQFYGFRDIPIGSDMPDNGTTVNSPDMVGPCAALASPSTPQPTAVVPLYRKTLASEPNGSVVMVGIGYEENLASLLASPPDSISPLSGSALVAEKVKELVIMGGGYPSRAGENNLIGNPVAAEAVAASWPTKVVYSGYEVGYGVFTGHTLSTVHPANSPIRVAYEALVGVGKNNRSFDLTALYHALEPADSLLSEVGPGTNVVDTSGDNVFTPGAGDEYYLSLSNPTALQNTLEGLMDVLPGTSPQAINFTSTAPSTAPFGSTYAPSATGGASGNPVTFAIDPSSTSGCAYDGATGLVTFASPAGSCVLDADQGGSTVYAAAPRVSQTVTVTAAAIAQSISFTTTPPASPKVGDTYAVGATASSGLPVAFSIDASSTSGCTYSHSTGLVTFAAPAGRCTIDADQPGNATYAAAPRVSQTVSVSVLAQGISFTTTPPASPKVGDTYAVGATASSGLPVAFSIDGSSTSGCTYGQSTGLVTFAAPAGTCTIDADQPGNATYAAAPRVSQTVSVSVLAQSISFTTTPPASPKVGDTYAVGATASSGLPVAFSIDASSTSGCTYSHGTGLVTFAAPAGTCTIDADQPGNATYAAAPRAAQTVGVGVLAQSISFTTSAPASPSVGDVYLVGATASSGLPVAISIDGSSTSGCTYGQSTGLVTFAAPAGTCTIDADQPGNAIYAAAPRVTQAISVSALAQSISFTSSSPASPKVGDVYLVGATASSGLPVAISIDPSSTSGCAYAESTGLVTFAAPAGTCTIDADQAGNAIYAAAPRVTQAVVVSVLAQSISFTSTLPASPKVGDTYAVGATASSGLPVAFSIDASSTSGCTYGRGTGLVTFASPAGTCTIDADQPGSPVYGPAPRVQQGVTVAKAPQSIAFTSTPPVSPGPGQTFQVTASASSGLAVSLSVDAVSGSSCSISGNTVTVLTTGPCLVDANQPGNGGYVPATQVQQLEVRGAQTVRFTTTAPSNAHVFSTYAVAASASSGLPVAISIDAASSAGCTYSASSRLVTFTGPSGTCIVDANQGGSTLYAAAPLVQQSVKVAKALQSISYTTQAPTPNHVGGTYAVKATATSKLPVALTIDWSARSVCSIAAGTVTFLRKGTCIIDANQSGNASWAAAGLLHQYVAVTS